MPTWRELEVIRRPAKVGSGVTNRATLAPGSAVCGIWSEALALSNNWGASRRMASPAPATPATLSRSLLLIRKFRLIVRQPPVGTSLLPGVGLGDVAGWCPRAAPGRSLAGRWPGRRVRPG